MDDPYDRGARDQLVKETGENYLWDTAYYEGHYYVYFGWCRYCCSTCRSTLSRERISPRRSACSLAWRFFIAGLSALLDRFARYHFKRMTTGVFLLLQIAIVTCCGMPYLLKFPTFYSLPIMLALAFSVWGLYFWMVGRSHTRPEGFYLAGSLCMALVGCRPQLVLLSFLAFPLFWRMYITEGRIRTAAGARQFACLIAPYIVVCAGIMWYNKSALWRPVRFRRELQSHGKRHDEARHGGGRTSPLRCSRIYSKLRDHGRVPLFAGCLVRHHVFGANGKGSHVRRHFRRAPILWVLPFARRILQMRINQRKTRTVAALLACSSASACLSLWPMRKWRHSAALFRRLQHHVPYGGGAAAVHRE